MNETDTTEERPQGSLLRALVDVRDRQVQKTRIGFNNRLAAIDGGADETATSDQRPIVERWLSRFTELEKELDKDITKAVKGHVLFDASKGVKGLGPMLLAKLVAMIDIERAATVSALWRYAGYGVVNGEREKLVKGEKSHYNKRLKTTLYLVAGSFLRSNSPYRQVYDSSRAYYEANRPDWTKNHRHLASLRRMVKHFLCHLWMVWREIEGLPVREPYAQGKLDHGPVSDPADYGWKVE